jgi:2-C-methyl-D-erythritol 4-phosphate cytidylyltransferase
VSVWAVLVAAGRGERLGEDRPKAFVRLGELPLLAEPLRRLDESDWIDHVVLVAPPEWEEPAILLAEELAVGKMTGCVAGGTRSRAESVRIGVAEVPPEARVIMVHDAARPLVSDEVVARVLAPLADGFDGAVPGLPIPDTVKRAPGGTIAATVDRSDLYGVQTPQGFLAGTLRRALAACDDDLTDCSSYVEAVGGKVCVVEGDRRLMKVTTTDDLATLEALV